MSILWPYIPSNLGETLKFTTDVRITREGEFRDSLHNAIPLLNFTYHRGIGGESSQLENTFLGNILGEWKLPLWQYATEVSALTSGAGTIAVSDADYRVDGEALVWESEDKYEVVTIETYAGGTLGLESGSELTQAYSAGTWVMPLLEAIAPSGLEIGRGINYQSKSIQFHVMDHSDLAASNYPTYQGYDLILDGVVVDSTIDGSLKQNLDFIQNGFGGMKLMPIANYSRYRSTVGYADTGHSARWARIQHLHRMRGKDRPFWLSTLQADMVTASAIGSSTTSWTVLANSLDTANISELVGRHIHVAGGSDITREITSVVDLGATVILNVATGPGEALPEGQAISFLRLMRYDTDSFEMTHRRISGDWLTRFSASVIEVIE